MLGARRLPADLGKVADCFVGKTKVDGLFAGLAPFSEYVGLGIPVRTADLLGRAEELDGRLAGIVEAFEGKTKVRIGADGKD